MAVELFNAARKNFGQSQKSVRSFYNRQLFGELKKVIDLKQLLCEMGISKNYYINYLNGYSVLSLTQICIIMDFLTQNYKCSDDDSVYFLVCEKIAYCWIITKIFSET